MLRTDKLIGLISVSQPNISWRVNQTNKIIHSTHTKKKKKVRRINS